MVKGVAMRLLRFTGLLLLLWGGADPAPGVGAPARVVAQEPIGPIAGIVLDTAGNGWAWRYKTLIRLENGAWHDRPGPALEEIRRVAITANGADGWLVGTVGTPGGGHAFRLYRWRQGTWQRVSLNAPSLISEPDLVLASDGSDGWIHIKYPSLLFRLRNGAWTAVPSPAPDGFDAMSLSPDGTHGWAVALAGTGPLQITEGAATLYQLVRGSWQPVRSLTLLPNQTYYPALQLSTSNSGLGWLLDVGQPGAGGPTMLWRLAPAQPPRSVSLPPPAAHPGWAWLVTALTVDDRGRGWLAGSIGEPIPSKGINGRTPLALLRLDGETLTELPVAAPTHPATALGSSPDGAHTWLAVTDNPAGGAYTALRELADPWMHPAPAAAAPLPGAGRCFAEVPYCLRGVFARYWAQHGGLRPLGFPITPEVTELQGGRPYTVQYTQRARFEYHPENQSPNDVLLGLLGNSRADARQDAGPFQPTPQSAAPDGRWFPQTRHNLAAPFLAYWNGHGGLPIFGLPRSEAFDERNSADGTTYRVQYFERARIEYHPEHKGTRFEFLLGLLGVEQFRATYGYTP
jgi:hypothetical protein